MYTSKPAGGVWSQPFNLSGATLGVLRQDLAVSPDGTVHVVWRQFEEVDGRGFDSVFYSSKSPSGGWTPPKDIDQSDLDVDNPPLITVDGSGKVHVVWQDNYTTSSGAGWSTPVKIGGNFNDTRDLIAKTNGILHLLSKKSEVLYHTIRDGAGTWGDPEIIASDASQGLNPNLPSLHVDNAGTLHAGWIARPPGSDTTDKLFHSTKGPSSAWSLPVVVNPVGNAGAADMMVFSGGEAIGVWANAGDIEISALHPDGTWLPAVAVAQGSWPVVAPEEPDTIHLFFNSGAQLFYTNSQ
ncbi:MAG: hypothetical protein O6840_03595 [Nitrospirae bacterium]|nr:hypothetical protein [Nitrospirota bacterium]